MPRHRGALETFWVRMVNPLGGTYVADVWQPKYLVNARVTAATMWDAAHKASQWYLHGAPVLAARREKPTQAGFNVQSFGIQGYPVRLWVREDY